MSEVIDKTEFTYDELSPWAQQRALDKARSQEYYYDWWEFIYEDAVATGALMGIHIDTHTVKTNRGREYQETAIFFSGFCSQGDGACYVGHYYQPKHDVVKTVTEYAPQDEELKRIAEGLTVLQVTARMKYGGHVSAIITTSGNYSYSGTMNFDVSHDNDASSGYANDFEDIESDLTQLLRDFADWIYKQLETENDYMYSEEYIVEGFKANENLFDEDGTMI